MSFMWEEINENGSYTINEKYQDGVIVCPDCCIGGDLMTPQFVFNNTLQMTCAQGIKVYFCKSAAAPTELLTFPCDEPDLVGSILLSKTAGADTNTTMPTSVGANSATPSSMSLFAFSSASASASAPVGMSSVASGSASISISASPSASSVAKASTSDSVVNTVPLLAIVLLSIMVLFKQMSLK